MVDIEDHAVGSRGLPLPKESISDNMSFNSEGSTVEQGVVVNMDDSDDVGEEEEENDEEDEEQDVNEDDEAKDEEEGEQENSEDGEETDDKEEHNIVLVILNHHYFCCNWGCFSAWSSGLCIGPVNSPDREIILEGERHISVDLHLCRFLGFTVLR